MPIIFNPREELHYCVHPKGVGGGTIWLCAVCGQHWEYKPYIFGNWWRLSRRRAQEIIARKRRRK